MAAVGSPGQGADTPSSDLGVCALSMEAVGGRV
jgi:hypothetical protein